MYSSGQGRNKTTVNSTPINFYMACSGRRFLIPGVSLYTVNLCKEHATVSKVIMSKQCTAKGGAILSFVFDFQSSFLIIFGN